MEAILFIIERLNYCAALGIIPRTKNKRVGFRAGENYGTIDVMTALNPTYYLTVLQGEECGDEVLPVGWQRREGMGGSLFRYKSKPD